MSEKKDERMPIGLALMLLFGGGYILWEIVMFFHNHMGFTKFLFIKLPVMILIVILLRPLMTGRAPWR